MEVNERFKYTPISKDVICVTCLSRDRKLFTVENLNMKYYCKALQLSLTDKVCWECKRTISKFMIFTQTALRAQHLLAQWTKDTQNISLPILSNLTTSSTHNVTCTEEYEAIIKNDIVIKSEPEDTKLNIDDEIFENYNYIDKYAEESIKYEEVDESKVTIKIEFDSVNETVEMPDKNAPVKQNQAKKSSAEAHSDPTVLTPLLLKNEASPSQLINKDAIPTSTESTPSVLKAIKIFTPKELTHDEVAPTGDKMSAEKPQTAHTVHSNELPNQKSLDYVCGICNIRFSDESLLRLHEKTHPRVYRCANCSNVCLSAVLAQQHYEICTKHLDVYECNKCEERFTTMNDYRRHKRVTHTPVVICDHCGRHFTSKSTLARHFLIHSGNVPMFECKICNKKCRWQTGLYTHMKIHSDTKDEAAYCADCDVQFRNVYNYKSHLKNSLKHVRKQDFRFPCPHCEKRFNSNSYRKCHIESMHSDEMNYRCDECEQSFKTHRRLRAHARRAHEGFVQLKKYSCTVCGRKFKENFKLNQHMNTHTGKRPYVCETCGATFSYSAALYTHKTKHKRCMAIRERQTATAVVNSESRTDN